MNTRHVSMMQEEEVSSTQQPFIPEEITRIRSSLEQFRERINETTGLDIGGAYLMDLSKDDDALEILRREYGVQLKR